MWPVTHFVQLPKGKGLPPKKAEGGISQLLGVIPRVTGANDQQPIQRLADQGKHHTNL